MALEIQVLATSVTLIVMQFLIFSADGYPSEDFFFTDEPEILSQSVDNDDEQQSSPVEDELEILIDIRTDFEDECSGSGSGEGSGSWEGSGNPSRCNGGSGSGEGSGRGWASTFLDNE
jgi:hypothetical protein